MKVVQFHKNLCNEVNKTSHDRYIYIPGTSLIIMRPNKFGPQLTTLDRFHCSKLS